MLQKAEACPAVVSPSRLDGPGQANIGALGSRCVLRIGANLPLFPDGLANDAGPFATREVRVE